MMAQHAGNNALAAPSTGPEVLPSPGAASCGTAALAVAAMADGADGLASCAADMGHAPACAGGEGAIGKSATVTAMPATAASLAIAASAGTVLAVTAAAAAFVNDSAEQAGTRRLKEGLARGTFEGPRPLAGAVWHVFATSVAARIRGYYDALPEACVSNPTVSPLCAEGSSWLREPMMRYFLEFAMGAGGCGLSRQDQMAFAAFLHSGENGAKDANGGDFP